MSKQKNNIEDMFHKIFPAAAEAAEADHGGFNIGDLIVILLDLTLLIYTGYRSWHFLSSSVSDSFQILAIVGLVGLDVGAVAWSLTWMFGSTTKFQNWTSMALFVIDLVGVMLTSLVDSMSYGQAAAAMPSILKTVAWFGIPIIIFGNVLSGFLYHMTSPNTRRMRAERSQDENLAKQRERGDLELRRMNMMLKQAQDYTTERAKFLTAFAEVAEQNIAMADIEAQMMARLNKAAGGQLGSLMSGAGMTLPGISLQQPQGLDGATPANYAGAKDSLWDKLNGLKNKYVDRAPADGKQSPARVYSDAEIATLLGLDLSTYLTALNMGVITHADVPGIINAGETLADWLNRNFASKHPRIAAAQKIGILPMSNIRPAPKPVVGMAEEGVALDEQIAKEIADAYPSIAGHAANIVAAIHDLTPADFQLAPLGYQDELANIQNALKRHGLPDLTTYLDQEDWDRLVSWCERLHGAIPVMQHANQPGFSNNGHHKDVGLRDNLNP